MLINNSLYINPPSKPDQLHLCNIIPSIFFSRLFLICKGPQRQGPCCLIAPASASVSKMTMRPANAPHGCHMDAKSSVCHTLHWRWHLSAWALKAARSLRHNSIGGQGAQAERGIGEVLRPSA